MYHLLYLPFSLLAHPSFSNTSSLLAINAANLFCVICLAFCPQCVSSPETNRRRNQVRGTISSNLMVVSHSTRRERYVNYCLCPHSLTSEALLVFILHNEGSGAFSSNPFLVKLTVFSLGVFARSSPPFDVQGCHCWPS